MTNISDFYHFYVNLKTLKSSALNIFGRQMSNCVVRRDIFVAVNIIVSSIIICKVVLTFKVEKLHEHPADVHFPQHHVLLCDCSLFIIITHIMYTALGFFTMVLVSTSLL